MRVKYSMNRCKAQAHTPLGLAAALGDAMLRGLLSVSGWMSLRLGCHVTACLCLLYR